MSVEQNKVLIRRGYEALNQRDLAVFDELCAELRVSQCLVEKTQKGTRNVVETR